MLFIFIYTLDTHICKLLYTQILYYCCCCCCYSLKTIVPLERKISVTSRIFCFQIRTNSNCLFSLIKIHAVLLSLIIKYSYQSEYEFILSEIIFPIVSSHSLHRSASFLLYFLCSPLKRYCAFF